MRAATQLMAVLSLACACESEPSPSAAGQVDALAPAEPIETKDPIARDSPEDGADADADAAEAEFVPPPLVEIPPAPQLETGLPAVTRGKVIRLSSLPVSTRTVDYTKQVPVVALANPKASAQLDVLLAKHAEYGKCKVMLALETFVSVRCSERYQDMGETQLDHHNAHFAIAGSDVREIEVWEVFHPGLSPSEMKRVLVHDPDGGERRVVITERGVQLSYPFDGATPADRIPWRLLAPYIRADGPLGSVMVAQGVALAPPGTKLEEPAKSPALWSDTEDELIRIWAAAPVELRAHARLATPAGRRPAGLVFAPSASAEAVAMLLQDRAQVRAGQGYYTQLLSELVTVRAKQALELRDEPGRRGPVSATVPEGTKLVGIDGLLYRNDSAPESNSWAYVVSPDGASGWTAAKKLELVPYPPPSSD